MLAQSTFRRSSLFLIGAAAAWGLASAVSKRAVEEIPPLTLFPIQLGVSLVTLGTIVIAGANSPSPAWRTPGLGMARGAESRLRILSWPRRTDSDHSKSVGCAVGDRAAVHTRLGGPDSQREGRITRCLCITRGSVWCLSDCPSIKQGRVAARYCSNSPGCVGLRLLHNRGQTASG